MAKEVRTKILPWAINETTLGERTPEMGPGYGANLRVLADQTDLTAIEIDKKLADRLQALYGKRARIVHGDGTDTGMPTDEFNSVVSFMMLHHVETPELQDRLSPRHFESWHPAAYLSAATRCRRCRSGLGISATPTTRSIPPVCQRGYSPPGSAK